MAFVRLPRRQNHTSSPGETKDAEPAEGQEALSRVQGRFSQTAPPFPEKAGEITPGLFSYLK